MSFDKDALKQHFKDSVRTDIGKSFKAVTDPDPANIFRTGRTASRKSKEKQSLLIEKQRQKEGIRLAEADDEIARRKALSKSTKSGRRSLIQTSESGVGATNLGGTN